MLAVKPGGVKGANTKVKAGMHRFRAGFSLYVAHPVCKPPEIRYTELADPDVCTANWWSSAGSSGGAGKETVKRLPLFNSLSTSTDPPCALAIQLTKLRPSPRPLSAFASESGTW